MTQTTVKISGLSSKITVPVLESNFSTVGQVLKVNLFNDLSSKQCAEISFESEAVALKAIEQFNGKQLLKDNVTVELMNFTCEKEIVGELVYPVAKHLHADKAGKITGMIVEAVLRLAEKGKTRSELKEILESKKFINELVCDC